MPSLLNVAETWWSTVRTDWSVWRHPRPYYENDRDRRTVVNTGSVGSCMGGPTPVYVVLEGAPDSEQEEPFGVQLM